MNKNHSDEELMRMLALGKSDVFSEIYDRYANKIFTFLMRTLAQKTELAEDILQDVFIKIARSPEKFNAERVFKPWLYAVAYNECKMHWRSAKNKPHQNISEYDHLPANHEMIDDKLHKKEMQLQIRKLVLEMDEPHRTVVSLRYFDELSLKEIADIMDTSEGTVKSRLFYGLKKLSLLLKNEQAA